jgi:hypothetical protein
VSYSGAIGKECRRIDRLAEQLSLRVFCGALGIAFFLMVGAPAWAQDAPCRRVVSPSLAFAGTPREQAKCLLRPILQGGHPGAPLKKLPPPLEKTIGERVLIEKAALRRYLAAHTIQERDLGGSLDEPLSPATLPDGSGTVARYFVIHDVSTPNYLDKSFPANINDATWEWNDLAKHWANTKVAHIFVNRLGDSVTAVGFASPLPAKRFGTKFARDNLQERAKGLQIHVELVQPRRSDPAGKTGNDAIAPLPGFTEVQMDRLALLYVAASVRRGEWLVPAFHAAVDAGIPDAHDDPQNFDLEMWARRLDALLKQLREK